jgi:glyoxylase-like metal-dependent hydrolase (beta-lactamase superfamily II)
LQCFIAVFEIGFLSEDTRMTTQRATSNASPAAGATAGVIRVRMYRQGLGDCFLITLPGGDGPFHIVIDCGVVLGTDAAGIKKLRDAVDDINEVTGGKIDLLVLTHEHWDHVSGFTQAREVIARWKVSQVWTAWTEDPRDPLAKKLRAERQKTEDALRVAADRLEAAGTTDQAIRVAGLLDFFGAASGSTAAALEYAKGLAGDNLRFRQPGEPPISLPEIPEFRFYVLGPPKDEALLGKSDPSKGQAYGLDDGSAASNAMFLNALKRGADAVAQDESAVDATLDNPFESRFQIPLARAQSMKSFDEFFDRRYFGDVRDASLTDLKTSKPVLDQSWRRIDNTWLDTSQTLALALDSRTNNTSLVLAIERVETGEILLLPGDAQAGNWLSWQSLEWTEEDAGGKEKVTTGPDLLARTIFYKVGHHGSHNATLGEKGLELMTSDGLVAMIPVNHDMAVKKRWGKMPLPELVDKLMERTEGRVLRIDDAATTMAELESARPAAVSIEDWREFTSRIKVSELYFEISI